MKTIRLTTALSPPRGVEKAMLLGIA